ncbi:SDR family NAD(P)-dependent oxidoreductase [Oceanicoccus sp. KOV_DT_Chl]|uniref:SDR family NAD(P)-dependent oxidoreductase n=1 Tax=Oceanicoccus sp. KOV_DT_Chl TaxID=1904639 RepID=UPI001F1A3D20|nr:SDR family NAD(P)-dependent oxidoreductase [Oceanicoccus sp. KOV_DT_Chl]
MGMFGEDSTAEEVTAGLDLSGKTALVTGANSGLGFETARVLSLRGAHVIAVARTLEKANTACASFSGPTTAVACELSDFDSVVACSQQVQALNKPIDMLICNAGIMELPELEQVYGLERQFVVNYLGHFLLTQKLLPQVQAAEQGRLIMLGSGRYKSAPAEGIQFDNLSGEKNYDPLTAYGQSKLAMSLFARELSVRLGTSTTTANSVLPGVIMTNLGRHMPTSKIIMAKLMGWTFMKSVEAGAATTCFTATHPSLAKVSGHVFKDCNPYTPEGPHMNDAELSAKLWDTSMELLQQYL